MPPSTPQLVQATVTMASAGHDWIVLGIGWAVGLAASTASAAVAIVAVIITTRSARTLAERQTKVEEAKLKLDLFDRRYEAWQLFRQVAERRYRAVNDIKYGDPDGNSASREDQAAYWQASERLYFLFGEEVNQEAIVLNGLLTKFHVATIRQRTATDGRAQAILVSEALDANKECDLALKNMKKLIQSHMQPLS